MTPANRTLLFSVLGVISSCGASPSSHDEIDLQVPSDRFEHEFHLDPSDLSATGTNAFLDLRPGATLELDGPDRLTITVLDETEKIGGVETRVVEDQWTRRGWASNEERIYLAVSKSTHDVYCFGRDVTFNEDTVIGHLGTWRAGERDASPGLYMPAHPVVGRRFQQEIAPGVTMRRCEVLATDAVVETPLGRFTDCVRIEVTRPEQPEDVRTMVYSPGVGLVSEEDAWIDARAVEHADANKDARADLPPDAQKVVGGHGASKYLLVSHKPSFSRR
jgi:hypothetical protein